MSNKLYLVPTPIGNLEDITLRSLKVLKSVDLILAEDTRKSGQLLKHYDINARTESYHKFNEHKILGKYIDYLKNTGDIALITDAGTPSISDPGFLLCRECVAEDIAIECLPGATAFVPALVNSGLPSDKFVFEGFLPHKKGREKALKNLSNETRTIILYESPHRLMKTLQQLSQHFSPQHKISVSRELTKIYEETFRGTVSELIEYYEGKTIKGELVIVFQPVLK